LFDWGFTPLSGNISSYIVAVNFSGGGSRSPQREPPTLGR